jgi:hypothetical protein
MEFQADFAAIRSAQVAPNSRVPFWENLETTTAKAARQISTCNRQALKLQCHTHSIGSFPKKVQ